MALVAALAPAGAGAADTIPDPQTDTLPSFSESPGCGGLDGVRGPVAPSPGYIPPSTPIYGPWGDFYGRTKASIADQLVAVQLPNMYPAPKNLYIHERILPAFQALLANLAAEAAAGRRYTVYRDQTWSINHSTIPPRRHFSFHAVGAAIDVNSSSNPYRADNVLITNMPPWFVDAWRRAGWCWGGDWQTIKDPMHFAWMGPVHTPGYVMPAPQDALVPAADFTAAFDLGVRLPADPTLPVLVADLDRDGAVDVVRIESVPASDQYILRTAVARHAHQTCTIAAVTAATPSNPDAPAALKDLTGDGRADLVYLDTTGPHIALEVFPAVQHAAMVPEMRTTGVVAAAGDIHLFGDHDRDGHTDLYVVRAGAPATLEIWRGPTFTARIVDRPLGVPSAGHRFDLGDRAVGLQFDGIPDVYALADDGTLTIHLASADFAPGPVVATGATPGERMFVEDLDGDGHDDLLLASPTGATRMLRGGASTHHPGVWYELPEDNWVPGSGCDTPPHFCRGQVATLVGTPGNDVLYGNDLDNVIVGLGGNDLIYALGGDDRVCAGPGDDIVYGGDGRDRISGGRGADRLEGGQGRDRIGGGRGTDVLIGGGGHDILRGQRGPDWLVGDEGDDLLLGGPGIDDADGGPGFDTCEAETVTACEASL